MQAQPTRADSRLRGVLDRLDSLDDDAAIAALGGVLLEEPGNAHAHHVLAGLYAQVGEMALAKQSFQAALQFDPGLTVARFQLGQLLLVENDVTEAVDVLAPLTQEQTALGAYATAWLHAAQGDLAAAIASVDLGLMADQTVPALADDMRALRGAWVDAGEQEKRDAPTVPLFLSGYGRQV